MPSQVADSGTSPRPNAPTGDPADAGGGDVESPAVATPAKDGETADDLTPAVGDGGAPRQSGPNGDGVRDAGATIADGGAPNAAGPMEAAAPGVSTSCGDSIVAGSETCDDGNRESLDGCNSQCQAELGWSLTLRGVLDPAFDPAITRYTVRLPLFVETLNVIASAPSGVELAIDGASLAADGAWGSPALPVGESEIVLQALIDGEVAKSYHMLVTRTEPEQYYFKASNTGFGDQFGETVAISGDGNTLAVGAPEEDSSGAPADSSTPDEEATAAGAVYLFRRSPGAGWVQQAFIKAHQPGADDRFGGSVALSDDGNRLVVGARGEADGGWQIGNTELTNNYAPGSGAVYVFDFDESGQWKQKAFIKASNSRDGIGFGNAVALSADGSTLVATADSEGGSVGGVGSGEDTDTKLPGSGAAYVFVRGSAGAWSQQAYIKAAQPGEIDFFGDRVAVSGDGTTVAVGAYWEDSSVGGVVNGSLGDVGADDELSNSGAAYVFARDAKGAWSQQAFIKASNPSSGDEFGRALALNGDGTVLAVGAHREDGAGSGVSDGAANDDLGSAGAAYVYERDGNRWSQVAYVKASNPGNGDQFGFSVALDAPGRLLAVGAYKEDGAATVLGDGTDTENGSYDSGAVYVFERTQSWSQRGYVKALNSGEGDYFGWSVALSADGSALAVGSRAEESSESGLNANPNDDGANLAGAVYVLQ